MIDSNLFLPCGIEIKNRFLKSAIKSSILPFLIRAKAFPLKNGSASTISALNFLTHLKILEF